MTNASSSSLLRVTADGSRVRKAAGRLDELHEALTSALRRAVPFLGRVGAPIRVTGAAAEPLHESLESLPRPHFVMPLACAPSAGAGAIAIDGDGVALLLDGLLGGTGQNPPSLSPEGLSGAQSALVSRVCNGIVTGFSEVLSRMGITLAPKPSNAGAARGEDDSESIPIVVRIEFSTHSSRGHVLLALPKDALALRQVAFSTPSASHDPRVEAAVRNVEVELVAELGHRKLKLSELARLKVGDTLRFATRIDGTARVRVGERELFTAKPTSQNGQIALRVANKV